MKQTQNQFHGVDQDKELAIRNIPSGSTFLAKDTGKLYYENSAGLVASIGGDVEEPEPRTDQRSIIYSDNLDTIVKGLEVDIEKTDGATGFSTKLYGVHISAESSSNSTVLNLVGSLSEAKHTGGSSAWYVRGSESSALIQGGGCIEAYGSFSEARVTTSTAGNHTRIIGSKVEADVFNINANITNLQGSSIKVELGHGQITEVDVLHLEYHDQNNGNISGDFSYVKIENDTMCPGLVGVARVINSESVLPSKFSGLIQAAGLINSGIEEHNSNADAIAAGLAVGTHYRHGDDLKIVH